VRLNIFYLYLCSSKTCTFF